MAADPRRAVPRTDVVMADPRLTNARQRLGAVTVRDAVQAAQALARAGDLRPEQVADAAVAGLPRRATTLRPVLNATGVVVHTNLGRAPLSAAAVEAVTAAAGAVDVEYDVVTGERARRGRGALAALRAAVPAAGDVLVVNNGAAALVLAVTALSGGREVLVSRGEMVEIGDGFRLPDLIESTGARIVEVGTTNRTSLADYAEAVTERTAAAIKLHPSNFRIEGFAAAVPIRELATLPVPVVADTGSGLLAPLALLPDEPDAATALGDGAALVTTSGDKLLGGPQAGLILGDTALVERLRRHPLARALRVDKTTLAALEATLRGPTPPVLSYLCADPQALRDRAERITTALSAAGVIAHVVPSDGVAGGGGAPGVTLQGWAVALPPHYAAALRTGEPCVVGRVERDRCLLDLRCLPPDGDMEVQRAVLSVAVGRGQE